tara:strand:- start:5249 stop:6226 length:978 start_codon:yes stop_codon:yes gene_type:complete
MKDLKFPNNKKFVFTIIDDTDDAYYGGIDKVYDVLIKNNLKTTKTVWVFPVKDIKRSKGQCLQDSDYKNFVLELKKRGFEIALHNVGSGNYCRNEIIKGFDEYRKILGSFPSIHINHSYNKDNIYCGPKRFSFPFNFIVKMMYSGYNNFFGEIEGSNYFWGDLHKQHISYSRNYEIDNLNTYKVCKMPYYDNKYSKYSNKWFASTFAPNQIMFKHQVNKESIDKLEEEGGICILYTHLGYFYKNGKVDSHFKKIIEYIGAKNTGLFVPVSEVLKIIESQTSTYEISKFDKFFLEFHSLKTRVKYRYFKKMDDYHFKKTNLYNEKL